MTWVDYLGRFSWMESVVVSLNTKQSFISAAKIRWYIRDCCAYEISQEEEENTAIQTYWSGLGRFDHNFPRQETACERFSGTNEQWYGTRRFSCDDPKETDEGKRYAGMSRRWCLGASGVGKDLLQEEN
jgi:hypothetical protein